jgi:hypothetical protein
MPMTDAEKQARLRERNDKKGLVQVKLWIPAKKREELHALAAKWRDQAKK